MRRGNRQGWKAPGAGATVSAAVPGVRRIRRCHALDWYLTVFEVIDMRSFSNLWYWIGLAVLWSSASHWVLGVPYDLIQRARRHGGPAEEDLRDIVRINCNRLLFIADVSGLIIACVSAAVFTTLFLVGFWYGHQFAQAVFLMLFPMTLVGLMSVWTARRIAAAGGAGGRDGPGVPTDALYSRLRVQRTVTQVIGMISIFVAAMWGMAQNMYTGPLGGGPFG